MFSIFVFIPPDIISYHRHVDERDREYTMDSQIEKKNNYCSRRIVLRVDGLADGSRFPDVVVNVRTLLHGDCRFDRQTLGNLSSERIRGDKQENNRLPYYLCCFFPFFFPSTRQCCQQRRGPCAPPPPPMDGLSRNSIHTQIRNIFPFCDFKYLIFPVDIRYPWPGLQRNRTTLYQQNHRGRPIVYVTPRWATHWPSAVRILTGRHSSTCSRNQNNVTGSTESQCR